MSLFKRKAPQKLESRKKSGKLKESNRLDFCVFFRQFISSHDLTKINWDNNETLIWQDFFHFLFQNIEHVVIWRKIVGKLSDHCFDKIWTIFSSPIISVNLAGRKMKSTNPRSSQKDVSLKHYMKPESSYLIPVVAQRCHSSQWGCDKKDKKGLLCKREKRAFPEDPAQASVQSLSKPKRVFRPCAAPKRRCLLASHGMMFGW